MAGILPFGLLYIVPYSLGAWPRPWMNLSALSLALIPLCFAYAIIRYRLMDVDIIFKRGLAYTAATAGVVGGLLRPGGADRRAVPHRLAQRTWRRMIAIVRRRVPVPAFPRLDASAPGPLLLSRPAWIIAAR